MSGQTRRRTVLALTAIAATVLGAASIDVGAREFLGGARADRVVGTTAADRILLGAGNDVARAGRGRDFVRGGRGRDRLYGGGDSDRMYGDSGADRLFGESGRDRVYGGTGGDRASGGRGDDVVYGQGGRDAVLGDAGSDRVTGGADRDAVNGGTGVDRTYGGAGDDALEGRDLRRDGLISGGTGRDVCTVDTVDIPITVGCEVIQAGTPPPPAQTPPGSGRGPGVGGGGPVRPTAFTLASSSGTSCAVGSVCTLKLAGRGAKDRTVAVENDREIVGRFEANVAGSGDWTVQGDYGCFDNGTVTLKSGAEQIIVTIACATPSPTGGGSDPNGPLTKDPVDRATTCPAASLCPPFTISGGGANGGVVATIDGPAMPKVLAAQAGDDGRWTLSPPGWGCPVAGNSTVTIRDSSSDPPVTATLTCT